MAVTYVVETTVNPGVQYEVSQAEYLRLLELGLLLNGPAEPVAPGVFDTEVSALLDDVNSQTYGKVAAFPPGPHQHPSTDISDSGSTGRALLGTTSAVSARAAIGAGTSSLALGTTSSTAKAGDYQPAAANISDATGTGRSVLTAADAAAARTVIGAPGATGGITLFQQLTQGAYDALGTKAAGTLYVIVG